MSIYSNTCKHLHFACQANSRHIIDQIPLLKEANSNDNIGDSDIAYENDNENIENIEQFVEQRSQNYSQQVAGNSREESESRKRVEKYNLIRSELREKLTHMLNGLPEAGQTKEGDEYLESAPYHNRECIVLGVMCSYSCSLSAPLCWLSLATSLTLRHRYLVSRYTHIVTPNHALRPRRFLSHWL